LTITFSVLGIIGATVSCIGKHEYDCTLPQVDLALKLTQPDLQVYMLGMAIIKISNLVFLRRIMADTIGWLRRLMGYLIVFTILFGIFSAFIVLFDCHPYAANWNIVAKLQGAKCINPTALIISVNVVFVVLDFFCLIVPIPILHYLNLPNRTRLSIFLLFAMSIATTVMCAVKTRYFSQLFASYDATWAGEDVMVWSLAEMNTALITVCLPTIDMILVKFVPTRLRNVLAARDEAKDYEKGRFDFDWSMSDADRSLSPEQPMSIDKQIFAHQLDPTANAAGGYRSTVEALNQKGGGPSRPKELTNANRFLPEKIERMM
jgi:hypothetical protein